MCSRGQLDLIKFTISSHWPLLTCDKWNPGVATWELGSPGEMYGWRQSGQCGSGTALRLHVPDAVRILLDAAPGTPVLTYSHPVGFLCVWGQQTVIKQWEKRLFWTFCCRIHIVQILIRWQSQEKVRHLSVDHVGTRIFSKELCFSVTRVWSGLEKKKG